MITGFEKIIEERILKAFKTGEFDNLPGVGKPLKFEDDSNVPEDLKLAYKILKNSGYIPPELELRKEIRQTEELLADTEETAKKYKIIKKLNFLIMKLNSIRNIPVTMELPQQYQEKLIDKISLNNV